MINKLLQKIERISDNNLKLVDRLALIDNLVSLIKKIQSHCDRDKRMNELIVNDPKAPESVKEYSKKQLESINFPEFFLVTKVETDLSYTLPDEYKTVGVFSSKKEVIEYFKANVVDFRVIDYFNSKKVILKESDLDFKLTDCLIEEVFSEDDIEITYKIEKVIINEAKT